MSEQKNKHRIFDVVVQKNNNLRRRISQFRNKEGIVFGLDVHPDQKGIWCSISVYQGLWRKIGLWSGEYFLYLQNGQCTIFPYGDGPIEEKGYTFSAEETLKIKRLRESFDILVQWFEDPETVRINPYHPEIILTGEEEDIDRYFSSATKALDKYRIDLALTPLEPGINKVRESTISFD